MEFQPFKAARAAGLRFDDAKGAGKGKGKAKGISAVGSQDLNHTFQRVLSRKSMRNN